MRLIDADALSESIRSGPGTDVQKLFADVCVATAPTVDATPTVRWIPVTERLPEYDARVLVADVRSENNYVGIWTLEKDPDDSSDCWFDSGGWWSAFDEVTHWAPLPELPEVVPGG